MTTVPAPPGWETAATAPGSRDTRWRLRGSGGGCADVYLYEAHGILKLDRKTTLPAAGRRVVVTGRGLGLASGRITDPGHLEHLAAALHAAADWMRGDPEPVDDPQRTFDDLLTEEVPRGS